MLLYSYIHVKQTYYNIHIKVNLFLCLINPLALELDIYSLAHYLCKM